MDPVHAPPVFIDGPTVDRLLDWPSVVDAMASGHRLPVGPVASSFNDYGDNSIMNLSAWIDGLGAAVKSCSLFPHNMSRTPPVETVQGIVILYDGQDGHPKAMIDGASLTRWKTVGDSLLGAQYLAAPDPECLLIVGAGVIGETAAVAYPALFPSIRRILVWNRNSSRVEEVALRLKDGLTDIVVEGTRDLQQAAGEADIISCATRATEPVILGKWLRPGQHLDLIGAYLEDMREVDDDAMQRADLYTDKHDKSITTNGEFLIPIQNGAITEASIKGDLYALARQGPPDRDPAAITLFKNGGGAHMDLMVADLIYRLHNAQKAAQAD